MKMQRSEVRRYLFKERYDIWYWVVLHVKMEDDIDATASDDLLKGGDSSKGQGLVVSM